MRGIDVPGLGQNIMRYSVRLAKLLDASSAIMSVWSVLHRMSALKKRSRSEFSICKGSVTKGREHT